MGRPKGGKNRHWSKEERLRIVKRYTDGFISQAVLSKEESISRGMLHSWITKYYDNGESGLENKKKPGNPFVSYQMKKNPTREETLEYENLRLRLENELLKKGLTLEEVITKQKR